MSNPAVETKIELVTEAIEALVLATVIANAAHPGPQRKLFYENVVSARGEVASALRDLLQPVLRVVCTEKTDTVGEVSTKLSRTVAEVVPYGGIGIDGMNLA